MTTVPTAGLSLGMQLYTVRDPLAKQPAETLRRIAAIGYTEVEAFHDDIGEVAAMARDCGVRVVSTHIGAATIAGRASTSTPTSTSASSASTAGDALRKTCDALRAQGVEYVGTYMPYAACGHTAAFWTERGEHLNEAGRVARDAGLTFVYHNHAVELTRLDDGQVPLDVLLRVCDPALVGLELDVFWASIAGADPVSLLERLGRRVVLLHLKDKAADTPVFADDRAVPRAAFMEVGAGVLPIAAILKAAEACGVRHVFVEQDHTPGDPFASLERSFRYVRGLAHAVL